MYKNSVWKILVVLSLILAITTNFESVSARPNQEEAPQVPNLLSPGNGSTASSNPPTLCAQASDPDGNLQGIKFEVNGGGEGNHISPWIQVDGSGVACWQDNSPWSEQDHAWQARSVDTAGNQSGASGQWNIKIPVTEAPAQSETCTVNDLYADRPAPQTVGTTINFTVVATCTNAINKIETFVDGSGVGTIYSASGNISWKTNGYGAGNHVFSVQVFGNNGGTAGRSHPYDLVDKVEQQQTNPNSAFGNCEAVKIGYDVFVIVKEGSAIQRRHVPNPETLDALGFSQQAINNKGFSDSELKTIGQGSDIPDVVVDPNGFNTFKSTFCPNRTNQNTEQLPAGQFDPHASGVCPGWETRLWIGAYARITNAGDQLKLRSGPTLNDSVITKMSAGQKFTVIGGPQCNDSYTWWNIQGDMGTGWAAEAGDKWWMAPMTEAPTVDQANSDNLYSSTDTNEERIAGTTIAQCPMPPSTDEPSLFEKWFGVQAADNRFTEGQCTWYVYAQRPDVDGWIPSKEKGGADAHTWDDFAIEKGLLVDNNPVAGDIVVFEKSCGSAYSSHGHVAYVKSVFEEDGKLYIIVDEANRDGKGTVTLDSKYVVRDANCMKFIHSPTVQSQSGENNEQPANNQQQTTKIKLWDKFVSWFNSLFKK